jgi:hypothetical protein
VTKRTPDGSILPLAHVPTVQSFLGSTVQSFLGSDEGFREILEAAPSFTAEDLVGMVFSPQTSYSKTERELIGRLAHSIANAEKEVLADVAAAAILEKLKLKSIFVNFLHCVYHRDKKFEEVEAELRRAAPKIFARERAKDAAHAKLVKDTDGKQAAKAKAKTLWLERRDGKHSKLRTNDLFAAEAARRWPVLKIGTILKWCTAWEKEAKSASAS